MKSTSCSATGCREGHLQVFAEPARIVIDDRLGVAERFQQRIHLQNSRRQLTIRRLNRTHSSLTSHYISSLFTSTQTHKHTDHATMWPNKRFWSAKLK